MKWLKNRNLRIVFSFIIGLVVLSVIVPIFLELFVWRNQIYSAISNSDWSAFLGSYLGGVIGGTATLLALWITSIDFKDGQHKEQLDRIISMCASYAQNIDTLHSLAYKIYQLNDNREFITELNDIEKNLNYLNAPSCEAKEKLLDRRKELNRLQEERTHKKGETLEKCIKAENELTHLALILEIYLQDLECAKRLLDEIQSAEKIIKQIQDLIEGNKLQDKENLIEELKSANVKEAAKQFVCDYKKAYIFS